MTKGRAVTPSLFIYTAILTPSIIPSYWVGK